MVTDHRLRQRRVRRRGRADVPVRVRHPARHQPPSLGRIRGAAIGLALAVVHLVGIPLTGTSVNPARSIGPALFAGGQALTQLWLFIVAPLIGAAIAAAVASFLAVAEVTEVEEPGLGATGEPVEASRSFERP